MTVKILLLEILFVVGCHVFIGLFRQPYTDHWKLGSYILMMIMKVNMKQLTQDDKQGSLKIYFLPCQNNNEEADDVECNQSL